VVERLAPAAADPALRQGLVDLQSSATRQLEAATDHPGLGTPPYLGGVGVWNAFDG